jgi:type I restriction enzyme R subunit
MTKITNRTVDKSFEIYLALYQAVTGTEEEKNIFKQFSPDFFDLIVVDECHRGSAAEDSAWREVLDYFDSATQIGSPPRPRRPKDVSTHHYFGEPVYTYSLKQGIEDGFLAPYKVVRIDLDKDLEGWRPEKGKLDKPRPGDRGPHLQPARLRPHLILKKRTELVAKRRSPSFSRRRPLRQDDRLLRGHRPRRAHADGAGQRERRPARAGEPQVRHAHHGRQRRGQGRARQLHRPREALPGHRHHLEAHDDRRRRQTCKLIVLDQTHPSMTEFKQIIGRGTRINEDFGKLYFTIMDFKEGDRALRRPGFDGDPVQSSTSPGRPDRSARRRRRRDRPSPTTGPMGGTRRGGEGPDPRGEVRRTWS